MINDFKMDEDLKDLTSRLATYFREKYPIKGYLKRRFDNGDDTIVTVSKGGLFGYLSRTTDGSHTIIEIFRGKIYATAGKGDYLVTKGLLLDSFNKSIPEAMKVCTVEAERKVYLEEDILNLVNSSLGCRWVAAGILSGYSDAAITHFVRKLKDPTYTFDYVEEPLFKWTGLVRAPSEYKINSIKYLRQIEKDRIFPTPFPDTGGLLVKNGKYLEMLGHPRLVARFNHLYPKLAKYIELPTIPKEPK